MKKNKIALIFITFLSVRLLAQPLLPESLEPEESPQVLTFEEFVKKACTNPSFEKLLSQQFNLQYDKRLSIPADQLLLNVKSGYKLAHIFETSTEHSYQGDISLAGIFRESGTRLTTGFSLAGPTSSALYFSIIQNIATDAFGRQQRMLTSKASVDIHLAEVQLVEAYEDYLATAANLYMQWFLDYQRYEAGIRAYKTSYQLLEIIRDKMKYRIADVNDENKTLLQVYSKQESLYNLGKKFRETSTLIFESAGIELTQQFVPEKPQIFDNIEVDFGKIHKDFMEKSRTYSVFDLTMKSEDLKLKIAEDNLLPSAQLYMDFNLRGNNYFFIDGVDSLSFGLGIDLSYDFLSVHKKVGVEKQKMDIFIKNLDNEKRKSLLEAQIRNLVNDIKNIRQLTELSYTQYEIAQAVYQRESTRYSDGKIDLNFLIQALNQVDSAQAKIVAYYVQEKQLLLELHRLADLLVVKMDNQKFLEEILF
ncbi:MAG: TolC family protein [Spirochaetales bacterium]|nr:TolC family protein [Spirochaetales bacterium]